MPFPIPHGNAGSLPRARVHNAFVVQPVDLKPRGNTVAVTALAENPFAGRQQISVRTQMSGGMAGPDESMRSQRIMHDFIPGLGIDSAPASTTGQSPSVVSLLTSAANDAQALYQAQQAARVAEAQARLAQANAQAEASRSQAAIFLGKSSWTLPLLGIGAAAIGVAIWLKMRKPARGRR